jgi:copper(I)-binding protein
VKLIERLKMKDFLRHRAVAASVLLAGVAMTPSMTSAHVAIEPSVAAAGTRVDVALKVGHGCDGSATAAIAVQIPPGLEGATPAYRAGWTAKTKASKVGARNDVAEVSWVAAGRDSYLADGKADSFTFSGKLPNASGPLWFKVLQTCESGSRNWSELPAQGVSTKGMKFPAALMEVRTAQDMMAAQAVRVEGAWVRAAVPGQTATGGFMKLTARDSTRLVGVLTPVAGLAQVHEMKMDGGIMRMRAVDGLELPAGKTVELAPGSFHLMLMELKAPVSKDGVVPLTLLFKDAKGVESRVDIKAPVSMTPPGQPEAGTPAMSGTSHGEHKH